VVYYKLGLYEEALNAMQVLIDTDVDDSVICYHLGLIYLENGMKEKQKSSSNTRSMLIIMTKL